MDGLWIDPTDSLSNGPKIRYDLSSIHYDTYFILIAFAKL